MTTPRERIIQLAKDIQADNRYGHIQYGNPQWGNTVPVAPLVMLGLLLAVQILDEEELVQCAGLS